MNVVIAYADYPQELATSRWRCHIPARALKAAGHDVAMTHISKLITKDLSNVDAVLAERTLTTSIVEHVRKFNCKLVFTFDDAYTELPGYAHVMKYWREMGGVKEFRKVLKLTDLNITPSHKLNDLYSKGSAPFEYVPNYLDKYRWSKLYTHVAREGITIGGGFSAFHRDSFMRSGIADALKKVSKRDDIRIVLYGMSAVFQPLKSRGVPFSNPDWVSWPSWPKVMGDFDIALAPSAGKYDSFRSNLRLLEAGVAGTPYIASDHGIYADEFPGGIVVDNNKKAWENAILTLADMKRSREGLGADGIEWASKYFMDDNVEVYERILG